MRRQRLNQRSIPVRVVAVQIDIFDAGLEFRKRKVENSAQREIIFNFRALLGPLHVNGLSVHRNVRVRTASGSDRITNDPLIARRRDWSFSKLPL